MPTTSWTSAPAFPGGRAYGPPRPLVGQVHLATRTRADGGVLLAALAGGIAFDLVVRNDVATVAATLAVSVVVAALLGTRRFRGVEAVAALAAAPVVASFLAIRSSPWLIAPDALAVLGLVGLAATLSAGGSAWDLSAPRAVGRALVTGLQVVAAPGYALGALAGRRLPAGWAPVARGLGIAAPVVLVLGALLSSADAVFASFLRLPDVGEAPAHLVAVAFGAYGVAGLVRAADGADPEPVHGRVPTLGRIEATMIVGSIATLLAAFAAAQVAATTGFGDRVLLEAGVTYADHARSGFFQLLVVAALTLGILLAVRAVTTPHALVATLGVTVCALTVVVVWVSLSRLGAYEDAYGLTMLRLASTWFAWWVAALFVAVAVRLVGVASDRHWFLGVAGGLALVWLVAWNLANPEAVVVRHDITRPDADIAYLTGLSDDAVPALLDAYAVADEPTRVRLRTGLCATRDRDGVSGLSWNAGRSTAAQELARICP